MKLNTIIRRTLLALLAFQLNLNLLAESDPSWLAGDHHIHSRYSVGWDLEANPPKPKIGGDAIYPITLNAVMGRYYGLDWMVCTDHGGPNHSKVNLEKAYPELTLSRRVVPEVVQFYGMELNTPGADHSTLIIPHTHDENTALLDIESRFDRNEEYPTNPDRNTEAKMLEALAYMNQLENKPVVIANHPARSAKGAHRYGLDEPAELRGWNNTAPEIAIGMAGAPGHQAAALALGGNPDNPSPRGGYGNHPTMGGFDMLTARVGGFWDSMLAEGRHWWITANSDSHIHWTEGGKDFWPGEYSKTFVYAEKNHDDILKSLRAGKVFVATGGLITEMQLVVQQGENTAELGESLCATKCQPITITVEIKDPEALNPNGDNPSVERVDIIIGSVIGTHEDLTTDTHENVQVVARFNRDELTPGQDGQLKAEYTVEKPEGSFYVRVRGTNTDALEPLPDELGEDPWTDLWFYSNPVFVNLK